MKNLKKVLALVLAFACAFTMFAGAAFTDSADIKATEAVDALTALGVIDGYSDGSFKPEATVTRAEMAKMIFTILNGGNDNADPYKGLPTSFTDVKNHWAAGYVKYLQNSEIISGKSVTKFAPDDTVTGLEAAKMLLVVAGYAPNKAGLEGAVWAANTMKYANLNNLFEDVTANINGALPRQYAAQIMFNALDMDRVVYSNDIADFKPATDVDDEETIGAKYLKLGTYGDDANEVLYLTSVKKEDGRETYSLNGGDYTRVAKDCSNLIGQRVAVMTKEGKSNQVYGVFAYEDSKVVANGYVGQLETVSNNEKIKLNGTEYKLNNVNTTAITYSFNRDTAAVAKVDLKSLAEAVDSQAERKSNAAAEIVLIDNNGDGKVDTATQKPVSIGKVSAVTKTSVTVGGVGTFKFDDDTIYDGIAKNDYVRVIDDNNTVEGGNHVQKLDVTSGKVGGTRTGEAKVEDTWYKLADGVSVSTNTTYDLVIIGNTIFYADETDGSVKNVAYISDVAPDADTIVGDSNETIKARLYFADGTDAEAKISKVAGSKLGNAAVTKVGALENKLVTYTKLSDGSYDIKAVNGTNLAGCDNFYADADKSNATASTNGAYYDSKIKGVSLADDAVIYVETKNETKVLTGAQVKDWDKTVASGLVFTADMLTKESNGIDYVQVAVLNDDDAIVDVPGAKDVSYAYAVTDEYVATVDGEDKAAVDVWTGSETKTLYADAGDMINSTSEIAAGDLISYKVNGKFVESVTKNSTVAAVLGFDGKAEGEVKVKNTNGVYTYTLSEDVVVLTVDDAANKGVEGATIDSIVEAGTDVSDTNKRVPNIMYILGTGDDAGKIVAIVIDSENNEIDGAASL